VWCVCVCVCVYVCVYVCMCMCVMCTSHVILTGDTTLEERAALRAQWFATLTKKSPPQHVHIVIQIYISLQLHPSYDYYCYDSVKLRVHWLLPTKVLYLHSSNPPNILISSVFDQYIIINLTFCFVLCIAI
jgi:hypothetical protein